MGQDETLKMLTPFSLKGKYCSSSFIAERLNGSVSTALRKLTSQGYIESVEIVDHSVGTRTKMKRFFAYRIKKDKVKELDRIYSKQREEEEEKQSFLRKEERKKRAAEAQRRKIFKV